MSGRIATAALAVLLVGASAHADPRIYQRGRGWPGPVEVAPARYRTGAIDVLEFDEGFYETGQICRIADRADDYGCARRGGSSVGVANNELRDILIGQLPTYDERTRARRYIAEHPDGCVVVLASGWLIPQSFTDALRDHEEAHCRGWLHLPSAD